MTARHLKFLWSHDLKIHRLAVRVYNSVLGAVPFGVKYGYGKQLRTNQIPYNLIKDCRVIVQIGSPQDTLIAGRSRGMYFLLFAHPETKVVIVEPDPESVTTLRKIAQQRGLKNLIVCPVGAWSEKKDLHLYINDAHPASNFIEGMKNYDAERMKAYRSVSVPVDTVDNLLRDNGIDQADLISITTNGSEPYILEGMKEQIAKGVRYIALARTGEGYDEMMAELGYEFLGHDDRGFTYQRKA